MKFTSTLKCLASALILSFSMGVYAGGGGGGSDEPTNDGVLPAPDTCTSNCGYEIGPNPSLNFTQNQGPNSVSSFNVSGSVNGFGGGTVYYPTNINSQMATIAIAPGFTNTRSAVQWWGPRLASHGFIVITIDTNGRFDFPESRGRQLDSALNYMIYLGENSSAITGRVDKNRLATMGFSMGGGGALSSASRNRLSATVPLAPWFNGGNPFNRINVPAMIMACENDGTAGVNSHASPFYNRIPASTDKVYLELNNGSHNCATGQSSAYNTTISTYGLSWLKRFLDKDNRYSQYLCGPNHVANGAISEYRSTCNF